jgi:3-methyladenine DNA glycosylase AlkC
MSDEAQTYPALKEIFDRARFQHFADETASIWPAFDPCRFMKLATANLDELGIMQRMRQAATSMHATLPQDYAAALEVLRALAPRINHGFASITLPEFVALYGLDDFDRSMDALKFLTQFGSAEFAIRHFLLRDLERTLAVMREWAEDENEHVRRLASEGARPRLPWSFHIEPLKANPSLALPILERLKADPSLYVRKSVANHLNDFSKEHPEWLVERLAGWPQDTAETKWIVRQALRTLVKKGDGRALTLIGSTGKARVAIQQFDVTPANIRLGDRLTISASVRSTASKDQRLVVDYAIHYVKKGGTTSRKVFKLKEIDLEPGATTAVSISQTVRNFTTRTHHAGHHKVELMVNGAILAEGGFNLAT